MSEFIEKERVIEEINNLREGIPIPGIQSIQPWQDGYACALSDVYSVVSNIKAQELYDLIDKSDVEESDDQEPDFGPWIPCTDKLPEKSGYYNVLVIDDDGKRSICCGIFEDIEDNPTNGIYTDERRSVRNGKRWHPVCSGTVLLWREYPSPIETQYHNPPNRDSSSGCDSCKYKDEGDEYSKVL